MTTPLQLRAFHREYPALRGVANVIASTMPLDPDLARAVERDWGDDGTRDLRLHRGRNPRRSPRERVDGLDAGGRRQHRDRGRTVARDASGGHLRGTLALADRLRPVDRSGAFELVGRDADIVKIAGKRASLAGLTRELRAIPGVSDGSRVPAAPRGAAPRRAGRCAGDRRGSSARELARRVDAAFLPRPLVLVDALPRNAAGKLPHAALCDALTRARDRAGAGARGANADAAGGVRARSSGAARAFSGTSDRAGRSAARCGRGHAPRGRVARRRLRDRRSFSPRCCRIRWWTSGSTSTSARMRVSRSSPPDAPLPPEACTAHASRALR